MGFIENVLARITAVLPEPKEGEERPEIVLPPLPWEVGASAGETVPVITRTTAREEGEILIRETLSQVIIGKIPEEVDIEPPAMAQARGVQHSRGGVVLFEQNSASSTIEGYGSSAHGVAGTPAIKARRRGLRRR